jgi:hypothetical protein
LENKIIDKNHLAMYNFEKPGYKFETTGGARVGRANATWPFATLKVSKDILELNASIIGSLIFQPKDIISIEPFNGLSPLGRGIKINHKVSHYKTEVIFWTSQNSKTLIDQIYSTGFLENKDNRVIENEAEILQMQTSGAFPIKKPVAIGVIVFWNLLFLLSFLNYTSSDSKTTPFSYGSLIAVGGIFLFSILLIFLKPLGKLVMKEGRNVNDIKKFLYFLAAISGLMFIAFAALVSMKH